MRQSRGVPSARNSLVRLNPARRTSLWEVGRVITKVRPWNMLVFCLSFLSSIWLGWVTLVSITPERNVSSIFLSLMAQIPLAYEVETSSAEPKPRLHTPGTADVLLKTVYGSASELCSWWSTEEVAIPGCCLRDQWKILTPQTEGEMWRQQP